MFILSRFDRIVTEDILTYIYTYTISRMFQMLEMLDDGNCIFRKGTEEGRRGEGGGEATLDSSLRFMYSDFFFSSSFQPRAVCIIIPEQLYAHRLFSPLPRPRSLGAIVIFAAAFFLRCASLSLRANRRRGRFLTARLESRNMNA